MYTSYIGRHFLELYNQKKGTNYTAEHFFEEQFFPLFFNNEQHLMHVHGSSFFQKVSPKSLTGGINKNVFRLERLKRDIEANKISGSTFVGYAAGESDAVTSGQVSDLSGLIVDKEELYASWIGQGLAIGISGGNFLLKNDDVLWHLYQGWRHYRKYLSHTPNIKDKQIETWNGNWLAHTLSDKYNPNNPMLGLSIKPERVQGNIAIPTISWSEMFFKLSIRFPINEITINAYILSKTNKTFGFIKVFLPEVRKPIDFIHKLYDFKEFQSQINREDIEKFETFYNFKSACRMGTIGLRALEPKGLRAFMPQGSMPFAQGKELKFTNEQSYYLYEIYQIWIMATLNKTKLLELASKMASILKDLEELDERGKKVMKTLSDDTRDSKNVKSFIDNLSNVVEQVPTNTKEPIRDIVKEVLTMPSDNYPLFITLIRFEYNYLKS